MSTVKDWIVINARTGNYECRRCGEFVAPPQTRMSFGMLEGMMKGFIAEHKDCKPRAASHDDFDGHTSCYCAVTRPPCSWCTSPDRAEED